MCCPLNSLREEKSVSVVSTTSSAGKLKLNGHPRGSFRLVFSVIFVSGVYPLIVANNTIHKNLPIPQFFGFETIGTQQSINIKFIIDKISNLISCFRSQTR